MVKNKYNNRSNIRNRIIIETMLFFSLFAWSCDITVKEELTVISHFYKKCPKDLNIIGANNEFILTDPNQFRKLFETTYNGVKYSLAVKQAFPPPQIHARLNSDSIVKDSNKSFKQDECSIVWISTIDSNFRLIANLRVGSNLKELISKGFKKAIHFPGWGSYIQTDDKWCIQLGGLYETIHDSIKITRFFYSPDFFDNVDVKGVDISSYVVP